MRERLSVYAAYMRRQGIETKQIRGRQQLFSLPEVMAAKTSEKEKKVLARKQEQCYYSKRRCETGSHENRFQRKARVLAKQS